MREGNRRGLVVALALAVAVTGCASLGPRPARQFSFSATGDGPRGDEDWELLRQYFAMEKEDGRSAFLLHVGDICAEHDTLPEEYYIRVADLFKTSPIPIIIVPGDNEWNDLDDPDQGWAYWERHFLAFEQNFPTRPPSGDSASYSRTSPGCRAASSSSA